MSPPFVSRESPSAPSQDGQPLPTNMDIDELIRQPGRETLPRLNPNYKTIPNTTVFGLSESGVSKSLLRIAVPKKKGRYVGIGRSINDGLSSSVHSLYPVDDLMEQIKNKDEEIAFLKTDNAEIRVELQF
ncbi:hypothetical protein HID58_046761 [Brassica napus]|uniref:Uncharacterized protein n=1 Tax=Brassica napus TaxID=3708 RepID=A0ABQ8AXH2_BRANA|nr:hypothetical protein HID58_046761 [Brassica napus]